MKKVNSLFSLMKSGQPVTVEKLVKELDVKLGSIMCMICTIRNDLGGEVDTVRDGRKAVAYVLKNADEVAAALAASTKSKSTKPAKTKAAKPAKSTKAKKKVSAATSVKPLRSKKAASVAAADDGSVPVLDSELEIAEISEREFDDIKSQLGLA